MAVCSFYSDGIDVALVHCFHMERVPETGERMPHTALCRGFLLCRILKTMVYHQFLLRQRHGLWPWSRADPPPRSGSLEQRNHVKEGQLRY